MNEDSVTYVCLSKWEVGAHVTTMEWTTPKSGEDRTRRGEVSIVENSTRWRWDEDQQSTAMVERAFVHAS